MANEPLITSTPQWAKLLEPGLRKIFFDEFNRLPDEYSQIFHVLSSNKHAEHDITLSGMGPWQARTSEYDEVQFDLPGGGYSIDYTHVEYQKGFKISRAMVDDELYNQINKLPANMALQGKQLVEQKAADVLNNGFSNTGYDGKALFAVDHPLANPKTSITSYSNLITVTGASGAYPADSDVLNEDVLNEAIILGRRTVDDTGVPIMMRPTTLVVPPELESRARVVLDTPLRTGSNFNDVNTVRGRFNIVVNDYLTDPHSYFILDPNLHQLNFFWRVRPEFKSDTWFTTLEARYRGYMRFSVGYSAWRGVIAVHGVQGA